MANPQKENGHIDIANEIAEQLCRINLRPYEWRTIWAIFRKTYGWHKKEDRISITQFQNITGLTRRHQHRALKTLKEKNMVIRNTDTYIATYSFQKDYTRWQGYKLTPTTELLPKQVTVDPIKTITQTGNRVLPKQVMKPLPEQVNTKENKETIQKKEETDKTDNIQDSKVLLTQAKEELGRMAKVEDIVKWLKKLPHQYLRNQLRFFLIARYPQDADRAWRQAEVIYKREQTL